MQNEIKAAAPLLDDKGRLLYKGYSKKMLLRYDRNAVKAGKLRIKEWDYYLIANDDFAVALTVADNSYMGLMSATLLDFRVPWEQTTSVMTFMPRGKTNMPATSKKGDVYFKNKRCEFSFKIVGGERHLTCLLHDFKDKKDFKCDITLMGDPEESMVIATPYKEDEKAFYYNQKINCLPASGTAEFDGKIYKFEPNTASAVLDWGRGVWTYRNTWYWGSGSGIVDGHRVGFNIGYGFGDTSNASENMIFYDGKAHKLDGVVFNIPQKDGKDDFLSPWVFASSDGRFECDFVPIIDRASCTDALLIKSDQHQVFGRFSGELVLDDGKVIELKNFLGFAEKVYNKW